MSNKVWVIIPAAGTGQRMQAACPKQYLDLQGKTVLEHTLARFLNRPEMAGIVLVLQADDTYWPTLAPQYSDVGIHIVMGGESRADSVFNGLNYLHDLGLTADTQVLVHDAARPCLPAEDLTRLLALDEHDRAQGALLAVPVRDTIKRQDATNPIQPRVNYTEDRDGLWHALTPQMAPLGLLIASFKQAFQAGVSITDEASALEHAGYQPLLVEGDARNIKITRPADLTLAAFILQEG